MPGQGRYALSGRLARCKKQVRSGRFRGILREGAGRHSVLMEVAEAFFLVVRQQKVCIKNSLL